MSQGKKISWRRCLENLVRNGLIKNLGKDIPNSEQDVLSHIFESTHIWRNSSISSEASAWRGWDEQGGYQ